MSVRHRSTALATAPWVGSPSLRLLAAALVCVAFAGVVGGVLAGRVAADPPEGVIYYSADEAEAAGLAIELAEILVGDDSVFEIEVGEDELVLDAIPAAGFVAVGDGVDPMRSALAIRQPDGGILQADLHGLLDAAFAPDASWLAVLDGHGSLLRLDPSTGAADLLAEGPFTGPIRFTRSGELLLRAVSSIHAPIISELTRLDPHSGESTLLSGDELVYAAFELDDGSIVYAAHERGEGTVLVRATPGGPRRLVDLGEGAGEVDVSGDGAIAFVIGDDVYLVDPVGSPSRRLAPGGRPRFSADGQELLVSDRGLEVVISRDGSVLARLDASAAAWGCRGGCDR